MRPEQIGPQYETKQRYATPRLTVYGSMRSLTAGSLAKNGDQATTGFKNP